MGALCSVILLLTACTKVKNDYIGSLLALRGGGGTISGTVFAANDGENGRELWITDGTVRGTRMIRNINPGAGDSNPTNISP